MKSPRLDVLLKHADALVTWWLKREKAKTAQKAVQAANAVSAPILPGQSAKPAQQQKSGQSVKIKDPATDPTSHLFKFNFTVEVKGLEYAKNWSMEKYGCLPEGVAIDCTETNQ